MSDFCVWLTGLPASGKTTLALGLEKALKAHGLRPVVLDGDNLRQFLWPELKFSREARKAQTERATYLAKLIQQAGGVPIVALISPYLEDRAWARQQLRGPDPAPIQSLALGEAAAWARQQQRGFVEVFVDCPAAICAQRDPKDLWARARRGEIAQFTGVDDPYEPPLYPEAHVNTLHVSPGDCVKVILQRLVGGGYLLPEDEG
jgi:adenylylsulfate kinase-like enzyme